MNDKPILFQGSMVRAILAGRKKQTRRLIKPQPTLIDGEFKYYKNKNHQLTYSPYVSGHLDKFMRHYSPYGTKGDFLWVRENFTFNWHPYHDKCKIPKSWPDDLPEQGLIYQATETDSEILNEASFKPSIHMPRWASRLTLQVTKVRLQRLQDITEEDAMAEGIIQFADKGYAQAGAVYIDQNRISSVDIEYVGDTAKEAFQLLWQSINGAKSWEANPWVWPVDFNASEINIDRWMEGSLIAA